MIKVASLLMLCFEKCFNLESCFDLSSLTNPSNEVLTQLLMYSNKDFPDEINRNILELTLQFIHETGRFD